MLCPLRTELLGRAAFALSWNLTPPPVVRFPRLLGPFIFYCRPIAPARYEDYHGSMTSRCPPPTIYNLQQSITSPTPCFGPLYKRKSLRYTDAGQKLKKGMLRR